MSNHSRRLVNAEIQPPREDSPPELGGPTKQDALDVQRDFAGQVTGLLQSLLNQGGEPIEDDTLAGAVRAAEWIQAKGIRVSALSPTHDGRGWFDARADLSEQASYGDGDAGLVQAPEGAKGEAADGGLRLYRGITGGQVREVLAHEVQHLITEGEGEVARPDEEEAGVCHDRAEDQHFAGYYGEFEAFWATADLPAAEGRGGQRTVRARTGEGKEVARTLTFANARQQAIFARVCGEGTVSKDELQGYAYIAYFAACDPTFAGFVEGLTTFGGENALASVRIDRLAKEAASGEEWQDTVDLLLPDEVAWLLDGSESGGFWAKIDAAQDGAALHAQVHEAIASVRALA